MKGVCASCVTFDINHVVKSDDSLKPSWLQTHDYVESFIHKQNNFKIRQPKNSNTKVDLHLKQAANKKILYWAAKPKKHNNIIINEAKEAYANFSNHGVAKCDAQGNATVSICFPQIYSTIPKHHKNPQTFHPHIHFVVANHDETQWLSQIYTKILIRNLSFEETMTRHRCHGLYVLLNTLPCSYYAKDHIPNSYNLPVNSIKKMDRNELFRWFLEVAEKHYDGLYQLLQTKKIDIYEIPIICYCAHEKCNASQLASEQLIKKGFVNVSIYEGGMLEYNQY